MMNRRRFLLLIPVVGMALAAAPLGAQGQHTPADSLKHVAIRRVLALQRTDSLMLAGIEEGLANEPVDPSLPAGFLDSLRVRMHRDIGEFLERLVPIYDSLFTASDIDGLLAFYETPVGKRYLAAQPHLTEAVLELGRRWGMETAGRVLVDLSRDPPERR